MVQGVQGDKNGIIVQIRFVSLSVFSNHHVTLKSCERPAKSGRLSGGALPLNSVVVGWTVGFCNTSLVK